MEQIDSYEELASGFNEAAKITKKFAKTFYFASRFLPKRKKYAAYSIYSICRLSDETVDNPDNCTQLESLSKLKENIELVYCHSASKDNLLLAFKKTVNQYKIPKEYFDELIDGMYMDLSKTRYGNFKELYNYCYKVAGIVGLTMLNIFGQDEQAKKYAVNLGIAMQLTNILRDIKEDYLRGRIYLPQDEMKEFAISENYISEARNNENFREFLAFQIKRARYYYANSYLGIKMITDLRSRFVISVMKNLYAGILDSIEKNNYDIFSKRAHVDTLEKIIITLKTFCKGGFL